MHIVIGALIVVGSFLLAFQYMTAEFSGFWNLYSAILLIGVPIGLTILTYPFGSLWLAVKGFARTLFHNPERDRERLARNLVAFGREVRRDRGVAASAILEAEADPLFRHVGRLVIQQTDAVEIEVDSMILGRRDLESFRVSERVLASLGDFAPAMGMIGTVIGLIQLLANMRDFEKLGPGMAIALLTTFYGLMLAHLLYLPLSRIVADRGNQRAENLSLIVEGMLKLARRRPIHEVEQVFGVASTHAGSGTDGLSAGRQS
ncbi:MAG: MotA/TolQ/ExbB proton channel family protein [Bradymonadaceae bacterium]|nr:MotA/TolQ/ExbB proton channel family protein [Lujinxingiaceae bacterium]